MPFNDAGWLAAWNALGKDHAHDGGIGEPGPQGEVGPQGPQGEIGPQGIQGIQGIPGANGSPGADGATGPQGDTGPAGADGADGQAGPQGIQGIPGNDGAQGPQGIQGEQGPPGDVSGAWPVGSVFISVVATNPATLLGLGTWAALAAGRMLVGFSAGDADFDTVEETGGAKTHTLTTAEMPVHTHVQDAHNHAVTDSGHTHLTQRYPTATGGSSGFTIDTSMSGTLADNTLPTKSATTGLTVNNATAVNQNAGSGSAHNNMPPYLVVYMWKRTA
jgi:microcystin-dependent protein